MKISNALAIVAAGVLQDEHERRRRVAPPMPLQGVWTADAGSLPPWKGDYHNDLNTQMTGDKVGTARIEAIPAGRIEAEEPAMMTMQKIDVATIEAARRG